MNSEEEHPVVAGVEWYSRDTLNGNWTLIRHIDPAHAHLYQLDSLKVLCDDETGRYYTVVEDAAVRYKLQVPIFLN